MEKPVIAEQIRIVPMEFSHLDEIINIEEKSFATPWSRYAFTCELMDNDFARYFVLMHDEQVIGYMGLWVILDEAHITNVAIHPDYRNRRLGEVLIREVAWRCQGLGVLRMTLEVRVSNLSAQSLYTRLGFVSAGVRKGYYTDNQEDAIIMWKELL
ncbi:MAG TPA: ribosomal protein S18-alanine N-acetyltransferase [Candidatus Deferrimicrobium sp.]|nr:ribosomal protein S18-alanine N-acetyltransferase [Candidatus Deferrimicrobium sp.]